MTNSNFSKGLDGNTSVGSCGQYRRGIEEDILTLNTVVWRAGWFSLPGQTPQLLFNFDVPDKFCVEQFERSWTGKTLRYQWTGGGFDLDLRTTLPGPLFSLNNKALTLRFNYSHEPRKAENLETGESTGLRGGTCRGQFWLLDLKPHPLLLVANKPVAQISVVSHRHWTFEFEEEGARMFVLPLLDPRDAPRDAERQSLWRALVDHPPRRCAETFGFGDDERLRIVQNYPGAAVSPRSPLLENLLGRSQAVEGSPGTALLKTWFGPYAVTRGDQVETALACDWLAYAAVPSRDPAGELQDLPEPLAFPGDDTWDMKNVGDRLMAWRLWAPHLPLLDERRKRELLNRLDIPTDEEWRRDLRYETETVNNRQWARHQDLWEGVGDAAYDYDWYNGLTLSGLAKACECAEPAVAEPARRLAEQCRDVREALLAYLEIYQDWRLGMAWSDTFGTLWNLDCAHNGFEGLLGESRLREQEGDEPGARHVAYLACKTGIHFLASWHLPDWLREQGFQIGDIPLDEQSLGIKGAYPHIRFAFYHPAVRNPYPLPRRNPQYSALLHFYGPREKLRALLDTWEQEYPVRYRNWRDVYLNPAREHLAIYHRCAIEINPDPYGVESGDQGISMHHIQPEILLRTLVFEEDPGAVEARYGSPLILPEQLLLRAGYRLEKISPTTQRRAILR